MKRIFIHVTGKVQGVNYRAAARKIARESGLTGFVQNENDGSVYVEAQGADEQLEEFIRWCRRGPESAEVKNVGFEEIPLQEEKNFEIRWG